MPAAMPDFSARSRTACRSFASSEPSAQATSTSGTIASALTISGRMPSSISRSMIFSFVIPMALARLSREVVRSFSSRRRAMARSFSFRKNSSSRLLPRSPRIPGFSAMPILPAHARLESV